MRSANRFFAAAWGLALMALLGFVVPLALVLREDGGQMSQAGLMALAMCPAWFGGSQLSFAYAGACLLGSLFTAGLVRGVASALAQRSATELVLEALATLLRACALPPVDGCDVVESEDVFALCQGYLRPRVVLSTGLLELLSEEELEAVILHERFHLANRDPLKMLLARVAADAFFFMPIVAELAERYLCVKEIDADRAAMAAQRDAIPMTSAFCKVARSRQHLPVSAVAAVGSLLQATEERIAHLTSGRASSWRPSRIGLAVSGVVLATEAAITLFLAYGSSMPMPMDGSPGEVVAYVKAGVWTLLCCVGMVAAVRLFAERLGRTRPS
ncbi:MAG TPA: M56 family metallopeptidase [Chloroflexota bacterium]|nr:M56 family metallopeptidase [Chloroflexota bacterium]